MPFLRVCYEMLRNAAANVRTRNALNKYSERAYNERQKKVIKRVSVRTKASERAYKSKRKRMRTMKQAYSSYINK